MTKTMVFFRFIGQTCYFAEKSPMSSSFLAASTGLDHYIQGWFHSAGLPVVSKYVGSISLQLHPPQKKQIESTNYHYFAKVFVTSHLSCWGVAIRPSPRGLPSQIGSQTWSAPASSRSFTTFMWPGFWWNALMDHFHREKRENQEFLLVPSGYD